MTAAQDLADVRSQIVALRSREVELVGLVRQEADEAAARARLDAWTRIRVLFQAAQGAPAIRAAATAPIFPAGIQRYWIVAGPGYDVLVAWEVTVYRGDASLSQVYGAPAPEKIELQVRREFDLAKARRV